jgi:hypothetical protein
VNTAIDFATKAVGDGVDVIVTISRLVCAGEIVNTGGVLMLTDEGKRNLPADEVCRPFNATSRFPTSSCTVLDTKDMPQGGDWSGRRHKDDLKLFDRAGPTEICQVALEGRKRTWIRICYEIRAGVYTWLTFLVDSRCPDAFCFSQALLVEFAQLCAQNGGALQKVNGAFRMKVKEQDCAIAVSPDAGLSFNFIGLDFLWALDIMIRADQVRVIRAVRAPGQPWLVTRCDDIDD